MIFEKKIVEIYKSTLVKRYVESPCLKYFTHKDFPGLKAEPFTFEGNKGQRLSGCFYNYGVRDNGRLVVFDHGIGAGHRAYMREIEILAEQGYTVFSYDHTGCVDSEGENNVGFSQSLADLDCALKALRALPDYERALISVVGHSWGAFSTLNISALHPDLDSCVAISGFIGVQRMIEQTFSGLMKGYRRAILDYERQTNPYYSTFDARQSLRQGNTRVLVIHSQDDPVVSAAMHFDTLKQTLPDSERVSFLKVNGKKHNPNYTKAAVELLDKMSTELRKGMKDKSLEDPVQAESFREKWDFWKMTEQDKDIWNSVFEFIG